MSASVRSAAGVWHGFGATFCLVALSTSFAAQAAASPPPAPYNNNNPSPPPKKPDPQPQPPKKPDGEKPHPKHKVDAEKPGPHHLDKVVHDKVVHDKVVHDKVVHDKLVRDKVVHESVNRDHWIPGHWHHPWHHWYWYQSGVIFYHPHRFWHYVLISNLDLQVEALQQTLVNVQSPNLSPEEKHAARAELMAARAALAKALAETNVNNQRLREIEDRLLAQQTAFSVVKEADSQVQKDRSALDRELHRVLGLAPHKTLPTPEDFSSEAAGLNHEQQDKLAEDAPFQEALQALVQATMKLSKVQQALYETDSEWVAERDKAKQSLAPLTHDLARDVEATLAAIKSAISNLGSTAGA